ncbi:oligopeptide/dipeptide ABC transporter, ATP-binding protein, C-terminal domain [Longilinea arvoryzae]|uniref:Oligopeptide/dipeptide ABC transporter, ATP-binding protein, C-terminal domain n=1 Tax=Longilinea arvoryzae TaxID=360412 RepID=A0A0S7B7G4_9CHLR|nr:ABC transporter ATP-binding protein [Longilinea arvoryzae]GAP13006.1 oligopeptide/dipeptide ABC transporter, ATP-binding protein, C-terminal domain [Longilinea arvoryzae]
MDQSFPLVQIRDLSVTYNTRLGPTSAVDKISFDIRRGEIMGLVGESGCGKSTLGKALLRMIMPPGYISGGQIIFNGENVMKFDEKRLRDYRGRQVSMIFQDPMTSLNPVQTVEQHLEEAIQVHEAETKTPYIIKRIQTLIERLGIMQSRLDSYPHQLSGGMRQRVMVGLGLVLNAGLIIADEATTSLDVIVEAKLVDQLREIRDEFGVSILAITHNIALVAEIADRVAVMYAGNLVELGDVNRIFDAPLHPYTQGLLASVPTTEINAKKELYKMPGEPPNLARPPSGCRFHPRCPAAMPICSRYRPALEEVAPGHWVHCWLYQDHPEKVEKTIKVAA